jgi:peptidoglycan/xylan/chitin deacetylase (PgdA/CDA1 family)
MTSLPPVLLYHAIGSPPPNSDSEEFGLFVPTDRFEWQMQSLATRGYRTLRLDEYAAAVDGRAVSGRAVLVTFDDAYAEVDEVVTPILLHHRFTAVMFAPFGHLGGRNTWDEVLHPRLAQLEVADPDRLREMDRGPWEVASHALLHVDLRKLDQHQRREQLTEAREGLSDLLRRRVLDLAYPYGLEDPAVRLDARAAAYRMAFTAGGNRAEDEYQLPRRAVSGRDGRLLFQLKTSVVAEAIYRARQLSRRAARGRPTLQARLNQ